MKVRVRNQRGKYLNIFLIDKQLLYKQMNLKFENTTKSEVCAWWATPGIMVNWKMTSIVF